VRSESGLFAYISASYDLHNEQIYYGTFVQSYDLQNEQIYYGTFVQSYDLQNEQIYYGIASRLRLRLTLPTHKNKTTTTMNKTIANLCLSGQGCVMTEGLHKQIGEPTRTGVPLHMHPNIDLHVNYAMCSSCLEAQIEEYRVPCNECLAIHLYGLDFVCFVNENEDETNFESGDFIRVEVKDNVEDDLANTYAKCFNCGDVLDITNAQVWE